MSINNTTTVIDSEAGVDVPIYLKIRKVSESLYFDYSVDGIIWTALSEDPTAINIDTIYFGINAVGFGDDNGIVAPFQYFKARMTATTEPTTGLGSEQTQ